MELELRHLKLIEAIASPFRVGSRDLRVTASIGISLFPGDGDGYETLVRNADEFGRIEGYLLRNPVRAGLAATPEEYPWCGSSITSRQVG